MASGDLKTYDPKEITISIAGVSLTAIGGFADGSFVTISQSEDDWVETTGADGEICRARNYKSTIHTMALSFLQSSQCNTVMSGLRLADLTSKAGVFPILIKDNLGETIVSTPTCWITKSADVSYSNGVEAREWNLKFVEAVKVVGGN
jgi:hypothetical protein